MRFDKAIELLKSEEVTRFIEIGPGKTMSNFIKKDFEGDNLEIYQTEDFEKLSLTIEKLK